MYTELQFNKSSSYLDLYKQQNLPTTLKKIASNISSIEGNRLAFKSEEGEDGFKFDTLTSNSNNMSDLRQDVKTPDDEGPLVYLRDSQMESNRTTRQTAVFTRDLLNTDTKSGKAEFDNLSMSSQEEEPKQASKSMSDISRLVTPDTSASHNIKEMKS